MNKYGAFALIALKKLSPYLDPSSIRVKATDNSTILSVNHRLNYLEKNKDETLIKRKKKMGDSVKFYNATLLVLNEKISFLKDNKIIKGQNTSVNLTELNLIYEFYGKSLKSLQYEKLNIENKITQLIKNYQKLITK